MKLPDFTKDELQVYDLLQKSSPTTKKAVETLFGMTTSTTNRVIRSLLQKGAIVEIGQEESSGGRPPALYDINAAAAYLLGVHISYGFVQIVVCDLKMHIIAEKRIVQALIEVAPEKCIADISVAVCELLEQNGISRGLVLGAGLGIVGPMHRENGKTGTVMSFSGSMEAWSDIPVRDMLSNALGLPVYADNSCSAGALAEYLYGDARGEKSVSFFICEVGIISGQITAGRIVRRQDDREDGFAHTSIAISGEPCDCGKRGCVRLFSSTRAIRNAIRARIAHGASTLIQDRDGFTFVEYADAAQRGDQTVIEELTQAGAYFGMALSNYINLLTPGYVAIGGSLVSSFPFFYDSVIQTLVRYHGEDIKKKIRFKRNGSFGAATVALGAAAMYYESYFGNPIVE